MAVGQCKRNSFIYSSLSIRVDFASLSLTHVLPLYFGILSTNNDRKIERGVKQVWVFLPDALDHYSE